MDKSGEKGLQRVLLEIENLKDQTIKLFADLFNISAEVKVAKELPKVF